VAQSSQFDRTPSDTKVRANQFPRSVSRAEPFPCFISIPSRARSAVVVPEIALLSSAPRQTPPFLFSPPAFQQATNALLLLEDSCAIGASLSPWARADAEEEKAVSFRKACFTPLPLILVISVPFVSAGCLADNNTAGALRR
jgi:hypothetical protein